MSPDFPILTFTPWYPVRKNTAKQPFRVILVCLKINDGFICRNQVLRMVFETTTKMGRSLDVSLIELQGHVNSLLVS
jgi:hypothetical protein